MKRKPVKWAKKYTDWTENEWKKVLFFDERHFLVQGQHRRYVRRSEREKVTEWHINQTVKQPQKKIFWGSFSFSGLGSLYPCSGIMNVDKYIDVVVLLTQNIKDSFEAKKKAGAVFVHLTAAYDTVWHRGLTCKLLRLLPDKRSKRLWSLSEIEVSPLPPVTANKAGYAVLKTAFLNDRSWLPSYLTSIRTIFLP